MKVVSTFPNGSAGASAQCLLEAEGIQSHLSDSTIEFSGEQQVRLSVSEEDFEKATELLTSLKNRDEASPRDPHPAENYPFLGYAGFIAFLYVLWQVQIGIQVLIEADSISFGLLVNVLLLPVFFGILTGFIIGCLLSLMGLVIKVVYGKMRS